jgi:hypothetical protein
MLAPQVDLGAVQVRRHAYIKLHTGICCAQAYVRSLPPRRTEELRRNKEVFQKQEQQRLLQEQQKQQQRNVTDKHRQGIDKNRHATGKADGDERSVASAADLRAQSTNSAEEERYDMAGLRPECLHFG